MIPSSKANRQNIQNKVKHSSIIARLFTNTAVTKTTGGMKRRQPNPFPAAPLMKVDHLDRIGSSHFLDGDTSHTADTSSLEEEDADYSSSVVALASLLTAALDTMEASEKPKQKKSVRFAATITSRPISNRRNYTGEVKRQCWYQSDEYDRMHESCRRLVSKYEQCVREEMHFRYCMRGLENQVAANGRFRLLNRQAALEEVFAAQYENPTDKDYIADCYRRISSSCQLWAHCVGLKDQKMAQRYHNV